MVIRSVSIDNSTQGIVQWVIQRIRPKNFIDSHLISINVSGNVNDALTKYAPIEVMYVNNIRFWAHSSSEMRYYEVDFQSFAPFITSYSIAIDKNQYPKYLELVGSNDHVNWSLIHSQTFNEEPQGNYQYFECNNPGSFRYIKIQTNSTDFRDYNTLTLQRYRFYGKIKWIFSTKYCKQLLNHYFLFFLIINR